MLHNNGCIVEYYSKLCLKTAQMYAKVHVHHVYIVFTLPCSTLRFFPLLKDKLSGKKVWYLSARKCYSDENGVSVNKQINQFLDENRLV